jgi:hypothetical protein
VTIFIVAGVLSWIAAAVAIWALARVDRRWHEQAAKRWDIE